MNRPVPITPLSEHVATIRAAIKPYSKDDWFQGCSHGGGIYMRDLWPVLDAAERSPDTPLSNDVVERVARVIEPEAWKYRDECLTRWKEWDEIKVGWGEMTFEQWANRGTPPSLRDARAALEAARYGEMVEALKPFAGACDNCVDDDPDMGSIWEHPAAMQIEFRHLRNARAILSSIGASQP